MNLTDIANNCKVAGQCKSDHPFTQLEQYESKTYSQNGEDGIISRLFEIVGTANRFYVEFGTGADGTQRNTRLLDEKGWSGLLMDLIASPKASNIRKERITAENIIDLFKKYEVPVEFDLLSIDIDGNDYWVRKALGRHYRPRVIVMEYNAAFPAPQSKVMPYNPTYRWQRTDFFGASFSALVKLNEEFGYKVVYCEDRGINVFFVREDLVPIEFDSQPESIFKEADYAGDMLFGLARLYWPRGVGHKRNPNRQMVEV